MDWTIWTPIITAAGGIIVGLTPSAKSWLDARTKRIAAEADAVKVRADTDAKATTAEVTAKVKLVEAQAEATKAEAEMDAVTAEAIRGMRADIEQCREDRAKCEAALADQKRWTQGEIARLQGEIELLFAKTGLTPREQPKVTP